MLTDEQFDEYGIMSDYDLRDLAKKLGFDIDLITYAENLDNKLPYGVNIINLGDNDIGGTHWTMWFVPEDEKGKTYYFDSFGGPPEDNIIKLSLDNDREVIASNKQIQQMDESHCGIWSLLMANRLINAEPEDRLEVYKEFINNN